jgi:hypothetical protein
MTVQISTNTNLVPLHRGFGTLSDGTWILAVLDSSTQEIEFFYSDDSGDSWSNCATTVQAKNRTRQEFSASMAVDNDDNIWLVAADDDSGSDEVFLHRLTFDTDDVTVEKSQATGFTSFASFNPATAIGTPVKVSSDYYVPTVIASSSNVCYFTIWKVTSADVVTRHMSDQLLFGATTGTVDIELHHNGDGKTVADSTPHWYIGYQGYFRKVRWTSGTSWSFGTQRLLTSRGTGVSDIRFYDGDAYCLFTDSTNAYLKCWKRDSADTTTTDVGSNDTTVPTGWDSATERFLIIDSDGNMFVFDQGRSTDEGWSVREGRGYDDWDSWVNGAITVAHAKIGVYGYYGDTNINYTPIIYEEDTTGYLVLDQTTLSYNQAPTAPTWVNSTGAVEDVAETLTLDWNFNDADGDAQSDYTLRKREGAGSYEYWNGTSWQASEDASTKIASSGTSKTLAASWGADGDDDHYYAVKTWDPDDEVSPWSSELRVIPSAQDNPAITAPTGTVGATDTGEWTVTTQTAYRVVVSDTSSTTDMDAGTLDYDSGWVVDTIGEAELEFPTTGVTRYFRVQTKNDEGLLSDIDQETLTVSYTPPSTPTLVCTEDSPVDGVIRVVITNPGLGAAESYNDLYRREGDDSSTEVRIASGIAIDGTYDDYLPTSGIIYKYKAKCFATNGTTVDSAWTA